MGRRPDLSAYQACRKLGDTVEQLRGQIAGRSVARRPRVLGLRAAVNAYFFHWREMPEPDEVERRLVEMLSSGGVGTPAIAMWRANPKLFSAQAAEFLTDEICGSQRAVNDVLKKYFVGRTTALGHCVAEAVARAACGRLDSSRSEGRALACLRWLTGSVLSGPVRQNAFYAAFSATILCESAGGSEAYRRALRAYVESEKRLGDPRVPANAGNWRLVAPEAARRYLAWMVRDALVFFFGRILPDTAENRRRRDFWLKSVTRIHDFQIAVAEQDLWKVDSAVYSRLVPTGRSALFLRSEEYVFVELSGSCDTSYLLRPGGGDLASFDLSEAQTISFGHKWEVELDAAIDGAAAC